MEKRLIYILFFGCALFLGSCGSTSTYSLYIDVKKHAKIVFPENIVNVAVVDNAGANLNDSIVEIKDPNEDSQIVSLSKEVFIGLLVQFMKDENFFYEVKRYPKAIRTDTIYGMAQPLQVSQIQEIAKEEDVDALISIDMFDLSYNEENDIKSQVSITPLSVVVRVCDAEGKQIGRDLQTSTDFVWIKGDFDLGKYKESLLSISDDIVKQLIPYWEQEERILYSDRTENMKVGSYRAKNRNWVEAIDSWKMAFQQAKNDKQKVRAASNIALGYENMDELSSAVKWVRVALNLIQKDKESDEYYYVKWYKDKLYDRYRYHAALLQQLNALER